MLTISAPFFGRPLEDLMSHGQNIIHGETETSDSLLHSPSLHQQPENYNEPNTGESMTVKKLNHNASERDRRKRINGLYSSLRSLLPQEHQMKKLSIPATLSRVLKFIPQLQKELQSLHEKKEGLLKRISNQENSIRSEKQRKNNYVHCPSSAVSATRLSDTEVMIQFSTMNADALSKLEEDGFLLLNTSFFESLEERRVFYNLHLQMQGTQVMDLEGLKKKLLPLCEKQEEEMLSNFGSNDLIGVLL